MAAGGRLARRSHWWTRLGHGPLGAVWLAIREFSGLSAGPTYLWPRWLLLRAVGIVYVIIFSGIIREGQALVGPHGIAPLAGLLGEVAKVSPGPIAAFFQAPSLFWLNQSTAMITTLGWLGMAAAVALVLNLWPRLALFGCWTIFLSFVAAWRVFSPAQLDKLMIEVALLCIPFAPAGFRPGLGAASPPRPITVFMIRWMLFRVMFESGIVKFTAGDPHWRDLTAMDAMYETSPFPTVLGYLDHNMSHAYHVFEFVLTFLAELVAPVLAVFGGRRGRWVALGGWVALQAGIQLTNNFGWLNTASIALGLVLLDDQMLAKAASRLGFAVPGERGAVPAARPPEERSAAWRIHGLRVALWCHFYVTLLYFAKSCGMPFHQIPPVLSWPATVLQDFRSANGYYLYARLAMIRPQVEFQGSNDGGRTWRTYEFRYLPQRPDQIATFIAPRYPRFEATMQIEGQREQTTKSQIFPAVAAQILLGNPDVIGLFRRDPFPDLPPALIRIRCCRLSFADLANHRRTGEYWRKQFVSDYAPMMYRDEQGRVAQFSLAEGEAALRGGNAEAALDIFDRQYRLGHTDSGFRLAELLALGAGGARAPELALAIYRELATRGEVAAMHATGECYENGRGVEKDCATAMTWYRRAAAQGYLHSIYALAGLHANHRITPEDDVEALTLLLEALTWATGNDQVARHIRANGPGQAERLAKRMSGEAVAKARAQAVERVTTANPMGHN